jgi:hypothetical protein
VLLDVGPSSGPGRAGCSWTSGRRAGLDARNIQRLIIAIAHIRDAWKTAPRAIAGYAMI